jgi:hypothetical protein
MKTFDIEELKLMKSVHAGTMDYDDLPEELQSELYEFFLPQMPYGTAKARTGDPIEFIINKMHEAIFAAEFSLKVIA